MSVRQVVSAVVLGVTLSLAGLGGVASSSVHAQGTQTQVEYPGSIQQALEQQLGQKVKLKLVSGDELEGILREVSNEVAILDELVGLDYYGATLRIDQVAAVIVRTNNP